MRTFTLRTDLERHRVGTFQLPLGLEPVDLPAPSEGYTVEFVEGDESAPDTFRFYAVASFDWLWEEGAAAPRMMSLGLHLRIIGRPGRIWAFERFLQHATSRRGVWLAQRAEIARAFAHAVPPPAEAAPC